MSPTLIAARPWLVGIRRLVDQQLRDAAVLARAFSQTPAGRPVPLPGWRCRWTADRRCSRSRLSASIPVRPDGAAPVRRDPDRCGVSEPTAVAGPGAIELFDRIARVGPQRQGQHCRAAVFRRSRSPSRWQSAGTMPVTGPGLVVRPPSRQQILRRGPAQPSSAASAADSSASASTRHWRASAGRLVGGIGRCRPDDVAGQPGLPLPADRERGAGLDQPAGEQRQRIGEPVGALPQPDAGCGRRPRTTRAGASTSTSSSSSAMAIGSGSPRLSAAWVIAGRRPIRPESVIGGVRPVIAAARMAADSAASKLRPLARSASGRVTDLVGQQRGRPRPAATRRAAAPATSRATADRPRLPSVQRRVRGSPARPGVEGGDASSRTAAACRIRPFPPRDPRSSHSPRASQQFPVIAQIARSSQPPLVRHLIEPQAAGAMQHLRTAPLEYVDRIRT